MDDSAFVYKRENKLRRQPGFFKKALTDKGTKCILFNARLQVLLDSEFLPVRFTPAQVQDLFQNPGAAKQNVPLLFLGVTLFETYLCAFLLKNPPDFDDASFESITSIPKKNKNAILITRHARSLFAFHAAHKYCGACGCRTVSALGGAMRQCRKSIDFTFGASGESQDGEAEVGCNRVIRPRIDPIVVIMMINDSGDRLLLQRKNHYPLGEYRGLSGHVEHGENLDAVVSRKVSESFSLEVDTVLWFGTEPWPYPYCLMLGCFAKVKSEHDVKVWVKEHDEIRWFSRQELREMLHAGKSGYLLPNERRKDDTRIRVSIPVDNPIMNSLVEKFALEKQPVSFWESELSKVSLDGESPDMFASEQEF